MLFVCGTDKDYNNLVNATDDPSWSYDNMLPHIKRIMKMQDASLTGDPECARFYGSYGDVKVSPYCSNAVKTINLFENAALSRGYRKLKDINCGKWTGFTRLRGTLSCGERITSAKAFLSPLRKLKNLMILQNAVVDKILLSDSNVVEGVRVVTQNYQCPSFILKAKSEIIVSAGAFNTPLILQ